MDIQMTAEDFTFAGIEQALQNGLTSLIATISVVGLLLLTILEIALGWNYFKLLLETVERYIVVSVLCYTSPLAFSMGASKATTPVFRSWCRMVGSQLLLLVMNVWFLRGFANRFKGNSYVRDAVVDGPHAVVNASDGSQWYQMSTAASGTAVHGEAAVERKPVYENGKPVYDGENVRTVSTETVRYKSTPSRYGEPKSRDQTEIKSP